MAECFVGKSTLHGTIVCPPNKSYMEREVLISPMVNGTTRITNAVFSGKTEAAIGAALALGAMVKRRTHDSITLEGTGGIEPVSNLIDAGNSATTARISTAISALSRMPMVIRGDQSLSKRPISELAKPLNELGASVHSTNGGLPVYVSGPMIGGRADLDATVSSQFVSALLIAGANAARGVQLNLLGKPVSKPYIDATVALLGMHGVKAIHHSTGKRIWQHRHYNDLDKVRKDIYIVKPQEYKPLDFMVPSDASSLAILLSAGVLNGAYFKIGFSTGSLPQGDLAIMPILKRMGADVSIDDGFISVSASKLSGCSIDLRNNPDLLPPLQVLAAVAEGPLEFTNVGQARFKETDRISVPARNLRKLGFRVEERPDGMTISKDGPLHGAELDLQADHRTTMSFMGLAMNVGDCTIKGAECVAISYPGFVEQMRGAHADISIRK
ncbi:MAG: 3-phosphoshikimate 1-carboxyvinyltransferase [Candidatus Micrarchaeota archaeon]|nr:3-phosphoshikimate 1-carboxyvinyltransferase [Candidatus Micrarchaeota archaeon]